MSCTILRYYQFCVKVLTPVTTVGYPMKRALRLTALLTALSTPVGAQELINANDALTILEAVRDLGYRAVLERDTVDDPMITSKAAGLNFVILFYGCKDHLNCTSIQFSSSFTLTDGTDAKAMNAWNVENRYGRAYMDKDGDAIIRYEFNMVGDGISMEVFNDNFEIWESLLNDFKAHIKF